MLWEALVRTDAIDVYSKHRYIENVFKRAGVNSARQYTWTPREGYQAMVRNHEPTGNEFTWDRMIIPGKGDKIRFEVAIQIRQQRITQDGRRLTLRESDTDYGANITWMETKQRIFGWQLLPGSLDVNPDTIMIYGKRTEGSFVSVLPSDQAQPDNVRAFNIMVSLFTGIATIHDPDVFEQRLTIGVGNAKAFGAGFVKFAPFGQRR